MFTKNNFKVKKVNVSKLKLDLFEKNLLLIFTGVTRQAPKVAHSYVKKIDLIDKKLNLMNDCVNSFVKILTNGNLDDLGYLLDYSWNIKKSFSKEVSNEFLDKVYNIAKNNGALGGKLLGAGSGGFFLFYAKKENHSKILRSLKNYTNVPFKFENDGTKIIFSS